MPLGLGSGSCRDRGCVARWRWARDASLVHGQLGMAMALQDRNADAMVDSSAAWHWKGRMPPNREAFHESRDALATRGAPRMRCAVFENRHCPAARQPEAHSAYAHALLRAGRLIEGWSDTSSAGWWSRAFRVAGRGAYRIWNGQDLRGKTILLVIEQGQGDTFQFVRYAPPLKALGATTVMMAGGIVWTLHASFPSLTRDTALAMGADTPNCVARLVSVVASSGRVAAGGACEHSYFARRARGGQALLVLRGPHLAVLF